MSETGQTTAPAARFHLTAERMAEVELGELLAIEENPNNVKTIMAFMIRFMVDENNQPLARDVAEQAIKKVTIGQLRSAFERVASSMGETAVPNG